MMFYALFFIIILLKYFNNIKRNFIEKIITIIGKSLYHIFLVQLIYYAMLEVIIFNNMNLIWRGEGFQDSEVLLMELNKFL